MTQVLVGSYLNEPYLDTPYLGEVYAEAIGFQFFANIPGYKKLAAQTEFTIEQESAYAFQAEGDIEYEKTIAFQYYVNRLAAIAMQFNRTFYNTSNLRILDDFTSRGVNNSNWTASSTAAGDFSVQNLDTDIIEQVWRSQTGTTSGVNLSNDTGVPQGVLVDTLAILGHNLTAGANISLIGSDNSSHAPTGIVIPLEAREENIFYIASDLPNESMRYRYWRISIDDPTNPDNYLQIGAIVFGSARIFQGENFVNELDYELRDFSDTVRTEGFTNVANSRAQKRRLQLSFRFLNSEQSNFETMRELFRTAKTISKCLWIPTPDPDDSDITAKFAVFAKMTRIPTERHVSRGPDANYVTFDVELDESN